MVDRFTKMGKAARASGGTEVQWKFQTCSEKLGSGLNKITKQFSASVFLSWKWRQSYFIHLKELLEGANEIMSLGGKVDKKLLICKVHLIKIRMCLCDNQSKMIHEEPFSKLKLGVLGFIQNVSRFLCSLCFNDKLIVTFWGSDVSISKSVVLDLKKWKEKDGNLGFLCLSPEEPD